MQSSAGSAEGGPGRLSGSPPAGGSPRGPSRVGCHTHPIAPIAAHCTSRVPLASPSRALRPAALFPCSARRAQLNRRSPGVLLSSFSSLPRTPLFAPYLLVPQAEQDACSPGVAVTRPDPSIAAKDCACAVTARSRELGKGRGPAGVQRWTVTSPEGRGRRRSLKAVFPINPRAVVASGVGVASGGC